MHNRSQDDIKKQNLLDQFVQQLPASALTHKQNEDAEKVLHCMQYVRDNLSLIQYAVDNPHERGLYRFHEDRNKKVLRDDRGTSFHIKYESGEAAVKDIAAFIKQVENILESLTPSRWMEFAKRFEYSEAIGCLEARLTDALLWAGCALSTAVPKLQDIMYTCNTIRGTRKIPLLPIVKEYCRNNRFTLCLHGAKANEFSEMPITDALLIDYIADVLGEDVEDMSHLAWHEVMRFESEQKVLAVLKKGLPGSQQIFVDLDKDKFTPFSLALQWQGAQVISELMNSVSDDFLINALQISRAKWVPFHMAARYQDEAGFIAFVSNAPASVLSKQLGEKIDARNTTLRLVTRYQGPRAFMALIDKVNVIPLTDLIVSSREHLDDIFSNQSPIAIASFMKKIDADRFSDGMKVSNFVIKKMVTYFIHEESWQDEELMKRYLNTSTPIEMLLNQWSGGQLIPKKVAGHITALLNKRDKESLNDVEKAWLQFQADLAKDAELIIRVNDNQAPWTLDELRFCKKEIARHVFEKGLTSWRDYHLLRRWQDEIPALKETLDELERAGLLFKGCKASFDHCVQITRDPAFEKLKRCVANDEVLFKVIKKKDWDELFGQMIDYNDRPATLRKPDGKQGATHKFRHQTGEIEDFKMKDAAQKRAAVHTHTKKLAATFLPSSLATTLFGEANFDSDSVGLLFDIKKCRLKALLSKDSGTYHREWVGSKDDVENYAKRIKSISFTSVDEFKAYIKKYPWRTNEVLAELCREGMLAIGITKDTSKAREIARQRQEQIQAAMNIKLPIVFYDNVKRDIVQYTPEQIQQDISGVNRCREQMARQTLMNIKCDIALKEKWNVFSFFSCMKSPNMLPRTAQKIMDKIKEAENAQTANQSCWEKTQEEVKQLLVDVNLTSSIFRYKDTQAFYEKALKTHFKV